MLSRNDQTEIVMGNWIKDPEKPDLFWWTVKTAATEEARFRVMGIESETSNPVLPKNCVKFKIGETIALRDLVSVPVPTGIIASAKTERGNVLATIGRVKDQLESFCGPIVYLAPCCRTHQDTVEPSPEQTKALKNGLSILMDSGVESAIAYLNGTRLFDSVFEDSGGCPINPAALRGGAFEWYQRNNE